MNLLLIHDESWKCCANFILIRQSLLLLSKKFQYCFYLDNYSVTYCPQTAAICQIYVKHNFFSCLAIGWFTEILRKKFISFLLKLNTCLILCFLWTENYESFFMRWKDPQAPGRIIGLLDEFWRDIWGGLCLYNWRLAWYERFWLLCTKNVCTFTMLYFKKSDWEEHRRYFLFILIPFLIVTKALKNVEVEGFAFTRISMLDKSKTEFT